MNSLNEMIFFDSLQCPRIYREISTYKIDLKIFHLFIEWREEEQMEDEKLMA